MKIHIKLFVLFIGLHKTFKMGFLRAGLCSPSFLPMDSRLRFPQRSRRGLILSHYPIPHGRQKRTEWFSWRMEGWGSEESPKIQLTVINCDIVAAFPRSSCPAALFGQTWPGEWGLPSETQQSNPWGLRKSGNSQLDCVRNGNNYSICCPAYKCTPLQKSLHNKGATKKSSNNNNKNKQPTARRMSSAFSRARDPPLWMGCFIGPMPDIYLMWNELGEGINSNSATRKAQQLRWLNNRMK